MTDHAAINARAIRELDILVPYIFEGATPAADGGWDIPAIDPSGDEDVVVGVQGYIATDGSGWIGVVERIQFADLLDLVPRITGTATRDEASAWLLRQLDRARDRKTCRWH